MLNTDYLFVLCPGWITNPSDGERYFISYQRLMKCYQLDHHNCIKFATTKWQEWRKLKDVNDRRKIIRLYPCPNGDYMEHLNKLKGEDIG